MMWRVRDVVIRRSRDCSETGGMNRCRSSVQVRRRIIPAGAAGRPSRRRWRWRVASSAVWKLVHTRSRGSAVSATSTAVRRGGSSAAPACLPATTSSPPHTVCQLTLAHTLRTPTEISKTSWYILVHCVSQNCFISLMNKKLRIYCWICWRMNFRKSTKIVENSENWRGRWLLSDPQCDFCLNSNHALHNSASIDNM